MRVIVCLLGQVAVLAKEAKKPFYVAAESYKFCRLYPLRCERAGYVDIARDR